MQINDFYVDLADGSVFVRRWQPGDTQRLPLILLHDSLGCVGLWRDFPAALADATQRPVIAYDRLGFGHSSPQKELPPDSFIDDEARLYLPAVAAGLGLERYIIFGHSVGGCMALFAASVADNPCAAIITESAQAFVGEQTMAGIRVAKQGFADPKEFARLEKWHGERARWVLDAWTEKWLSAEFRNWSIESRLASIHCPLLAINGAEDEYCPVEYPQRITQGTRGPTQVAIMTGCGHVPHRQEPDKVLAYIETFLREQGIA